MIIVNWNRYERQRRVGNSVGRGEAMFGCVRACKRPVEVTAITIPHYWIQPTTFSPEHVYFLLSICRILQNGTKYECFWTKSKLFNRVLIKVNDKLCIHFNLDIKFIQTDSSSSFTFKLHQFYHSWENINRIEL